MSDKKNPPMPPRSDEEIVFGDELPVLPIRNAVLFPGAVAPFDVGREKSVALVEDVDNLPGPVIAIFAQRDPSTDDPGAEDLYPVGCAARVLKALKHSSGNYSLILQGLTRIRLESVTGNAPYLKAKIRRLDEPHSEDVEAEALAMSLRDIAKQVIQLMPELPREAASLIDSIQAPGALADLVAANLDAPVEEKAQLIETIEVKERIRKVLRLLTRQLEILKMRERINSQIKEEMGKNQREYVLRQQLKAIKEELGEDEGDQSDLDGLEDRIAKANLPTEAETVAKKQLKRLRTMQVGSAEYTVVRTYLDWILDIPWTNSTAGQPRHRRRAQGARRGSLRPREGQEAHPRVPRRPQAEAGQEGADPLPHRPARRRQDLARPQHRPRPRPQVRARVARRRPRRGRHPRPPAHLRRRAPRADHPGDEEGGHREPRVHDGRGRQDRARLPRRPVRGAARGARPGAEQHLRRSLPGDPLRSLARDVRGHGQRRRPDPAPAPRPHGDPGDPRLHAAREAGHRAAAPAPQAARRARAHHRAARDHRPRARGDHRPLHARGRRPLPGAADRGRHPRRRRQGRRGRDPEAPRRQRGRSARVPRRAALHQRGRGAHRRDAASPPASPGPASAARSSSSRPPGCSARARCSSPASSAT